MKKSVMERVSNCYYGLSHIKLITFEEMEKLSFCNNISELYEIYDYGYIGNWYYIIKNSGSSVAINYGINNKFLKENMKLYMQKHSGIRINVEELKMFKKGIYPIIHKVDFNYLMDNCDFEKKTNTTNYDFLYAEDSDDYYIYGKYNNVIVCEKCKSEEEAIKNLLKVSYLKEVNEESLYKYVIDDCENKDFEMII